jgi:flagellar basal-body rod modification protein FlgD
MPNEISDLLNDLMIQNQVQRVVSRKNGIGKDDFLKLLFTQLKYQDFESSVDYKDLLSQLSILAQIEQAMNVKQAIDSLSSSIARTNFLSASSLIGKSAYVVADKISVSNKKVSSLPAFQLDIPARNVKVKILSPGGVVIKTIELGNLPAGKHYVSWDGKDMNGNMVQDGSYSFEVIAYDSYGNEFKPQKLVFGKIESVELYGTKVFVGLGNTSFEFAKVVEVRSSE